MLKLKNSLIILLILIIGVASLGCVGNKQSEPIPSPQPTATPGQSVSTGISDMDTNTMETELNNMDSAINDSIDADSLEINVEI